MKKPKKLVRTKVGESRKRSDAVCKACGGTGKNSKGGLCVPCVMNNRLK